MEGTARDDRHAEALDEVHHEGSVILEGESGDIGLHQAYYDELTRSYQGATA